MAGANPTLIVRVAATIAELRANLAEGKSQIETTTAAMQRMAASFSGDKIIQAAHNTVAAVVAIGGASKLTEAEMVRVNATMERALEKFRVLGKDAPVGMQELANYTRDAATAGDRLHGSLSQFDRLLASVGINLGSEIGALKEVTAAAGQSVAQLGLLATAGLAVGAAMAGWKLGRMVAEFFNLDQAIGNATARLLGWGDLAGETAAAKQDAMALASQRAGRAITDYGEAIRINTEWQKKHTEETTRAAKAYDDWQAAVAEITAGGTSWRETLETIDGSTVEATKAFLEAGYSVKTLAEYFGLSERQIKAVEVALKADKEEIHAINEAVKELTTAWAEGDKIMRDFAVKTHAIAMAAMREEATEQKRLMNERNAAVIEGLNQIKNAEQQLAAFTLATTLSSTDAQIAKIREAAAAEIDAFKGTAEQKELFTLRKNQLTELEVTKVEQGAATINVASRGAAEESGSAFERAWMKSAAAFESFKGVVVAGTGQLRELMTVTDAGSWAELQRQIQEAQRERGDIFLTGMGSSRPPLQTRQHGGAVSAGQPYVVGERRAEIFVPERSGTVLPSVGGVSVSVSIVVQGSLLGTKEELARVAGDGIMRRLRDLGWRAPSGA
jgi:type IV secretory pathway protease TraF